VRCGGSDRGRVCSRWSSLIGRGQHRRAHGCAVSTPTAWQAALGRAAAPARDSSPGDGGDTRPIVPRGRAAERRGGGRALRCEVKLLGPTSPGAVIDWHRDLKSGFRWPANFYLGLEATRLDNPSDAKVPSELSRGHHLPTLARAARLRRRPIPIRARLTARAHRWRRDGLALTRLTGRCDVLVLDDAPSLYGYGGERKLKDASRPATHRIPEGASS
jgi:hypothetical protein